MHTGRGQKHARTGAPPATTAVLTFTCVHRGKRRLKALRSAIRLCCRCASSCAAAVCKGSQAAAPLPCTQTAPENWQPLDASAAWLTVKCAWGRQRNKRSAACAASGLLVWCLL